MGSRIFNAQYQQDPEAPEGNIFKAKYLPWVDKAPPRHQGRFWISIDTAMSTAETADYTALTIGQSTPDGKHYVHLASRGHWSYEVVKAKALHLWEQLPQAHFIIERANVGIPLTDYLRSKNANVMTHDAKHSKEARAYSVIRLFEEKRVALVRSPKHEAGLKSLESELLMFPHSRYDDQVDSLVQALRMADRWYGTPEESVYEIHMVPRFNLGPLTGSS